MYYGSGLDSLNELAALSDQEADAAARQAGGFGPGFMGPVAPVKATGRPLWTPEMVQAIGGTITKAVQDVGALNIQRIYAQKGLMVPGELAPPPPPPPSRVAPWPTWAKAAIIGGAVLLAGALVFKATKK